MSIVFYRLLHVIALLAMATSLGGLIAGASGGYRKALVALHGTAMLIVLVAGFGALAKLGIHGLPGWLIAKLVIWLILGGIVVPIRKQPEKKVQWLAISVVLMGVASWLALVKPF